MFKTGIKTTYRRESVAESETERPDPDQLYHLLYSSAKKDYKQLTARLVARRSFLLIILILSIVGTFSIVFYPTILKKRVERLNNQVTEYRSNIVTLKEEIEKFSAQELEYKEQINTFEDIFGKLVIEDSRIIDFDLTKTVSNNIERFDSIDAGYRNIRRGNIEFKDTALTFDLGTGADLPVIYSILKRHSAVATIFVSNEMPSNRYGSLFNDRNLKYLIKLNEIGCEFGNHTWSHYNLKRSLYDTSKRSRLSFIYVSDDALNELNIQRELKKVEERLYRETGITISPLWRAPYGEVDERILRVASQAGYPYHIFWSGNKSGPLDFFDYVTKRSIWVKDNDTGKYSRKQNPYYYTSSEMLAQMKKWEASDPHGLNGAITIAHLGTSRKSDRMVNILPEYISYFQNKGYRFVRVSELINNIQDY
ncbi:MAG: polysaccharide deacetylase family protein [Spirochaetota bacterium]|nr:MAG: polysaccharide deacetylase family protein [Spirochaetota bacterium]